MPRSQRNYELKRRKNPTRWGGGYQYGLYKEVPPETQFARKKATLWALQYCIQNTF